MPYHIPKPIFVHGINGGTRVFLPEGPRERKEPTRWILTDGCVALVKCPECGAKVLELCEFLSGKRGVSTHWRRRSAAQGKAPDHRVRLAHTQELFPDQHDLSVEEHW